VSAGSQDQYLLLRVLTSYEPLVFSILNETWFAATGQVCVRKA
jgi:hypothetical protein